MEECVDIIKLIECLDKADVEECQRAVERVANITKGNKKWCGEFVQANGHASLIKLLESNDEKLRIYAANGLLNLAVNTNEVRQMINYGEDIQALINILNSYDDDNNPVVKILRNIFGGNDNLIDEASITSLLKILNSKNKEMVLSCLSLLSFIASESDEQKQEIINAGCLPYLIKFITSLYPEIRSASVNVLTNICDGTPQQCDAVLNAGFVPALMTFLDNLMEPLDMGSLHLCKTLMYICKKSPESPVMNATVFPLLTDTMNLKICDTTSKDASLRNNIVQLTVNTTEHSIEKFVNQETDNIFNSENDDDATFVDHLLRLQSTNPESCKRTLEYFTTFFNCYPKNKNTITAADFQQLQLQLVKILSNNDIEICKYAMKIITQMLEFNEMEVIKKNHVQVFIDAEILLQLAQFQNQSNLELCESAVGTIYKICKLNSETKHAVINASLLPFLINLINTPDDNISFKAISTLWCITNDFADQVPTLIAGGIVPKICNKIIDTSNSEILEPAIFALLNLISGSVEQIQVIIEANVIPRFVELLTVTDSKVCIAAAAVLAGICRGTNEQTQAVIDAGAIPFLVSFLDEVECNTMKQQAALNVLVNIAHGAREQKQAILDANIIPYIYILLDSFEVSIVIKATKVLTNITKIKPPQLITIESSVLYYLSHFLVSENPNPSLCMTVAMLIANLALTDVKQKQYVMDSGIVNSVVECLRKFSSELIRNAELSDIDEAIKSGGKAIYDDAENSNITDYDICYILINALHNLSYTEIRQNLIKKDTIILITKFLKPKFESICEKAVTTLIGLTKTKNGKAIVAANSVLPLVRLLKLPKLEYSVTCALLDITACEEGRELVIQAGAIPILSELIKTKNDNDGKLVIAIFPTLKSENLQICVNAIEILANISCTIPSGANEVIGHVQYLVKLLYSPNMEIQNAAASTISNLCKGLAFHREKVFKEGAIKPLIALLSNMATFENSARAIVSLTEDIVAMQEVIEAGAIEILVEALESPSNIIRYLVAIILSNISNGDETKKQALIDAGAVSAIIKSFDYSNQKLCLPLWSTLQSLLNGNDKQRQFVVECGVIPCLIELLKFEDVVHLILNTFVRIAAGTIDEKEKLIEAGVLEHFVKYLPSPNEKSRKAAVACILHIAAGTEKHIGAVINAGAVPHLLDLLTSKDENIRILAIYTFTNISEGTNEQRDAILEAIPFLIKVLESFDMQLREAAVKALRNFTKESSYQSEIVVEEGAVPYLVKLLIGENKKIAKYAEEALKHMLTNNDVSDAAVVRVLEDMENVLKNSSNLIKIIGEQLVECQFIKIISALKENRNAELIFDAATKFLQYFDENYTIKFCTNMLG